ncbi:hypothetical protein V5O48_012759 [Marasmius crinis-equi]|uniref:Uncharacterized protein n=1 Tax=Marasmius crinis-equi TaxID=585013 RepID=A0ABR3F1X8_9AGAR
MTEYDFSPEGYRRHMEKQEVVRRWTENTGRYRPADPYVPATPAVHAARALKQTGEYRSSDSGSYRDGYRSDREYSRERNGSSGNKKHRSRSVGESKHSRSNSYSYTPQYSSPVGYQAPVIPGPFPQSYPQHPQPKRSATMPMPPPPPVPPMPSPPRRSMTTTTSTPPGYGYYYPTRGEPLMIPQGGIAILPPGAITPKMISPPLDTEQVEVFVAIQVGEYLLSEGAHAQSPRHGAGASEAEEEQVVQAWTWGEE